MKFPHYPQLDQMDCGPTCLRMIAKHFGRHYAAQTLRDKAQIGREGVSMLGLAEAAETIGFKTVGTMLTLDKLIEDAPLPCILHWGQNHFVVLYRIKSSQSIITRQFLSGIWGGKKSSRELDGDFQEACLDRLVDGEERPYPNSRRSNEKSIERIFCIADPASGMIEYSRQDFLQKWLSAKIEDKSEGIALLLEPTSKFYEEDGEDPQGISLNELGGYLWQYKRLIIQLLIGMVIGSTLSLLFPVLTQSVVDVGIGTQNLSFIYLVLIAQIVLLFSTAAVDFLRSWILLHISVRINLTILSDFLSKLMRLPLAYFDVRQFGDIMQRIGDHHRIESFLTGQALNMLFSLFNLVIFGFILAFYQANIFLVALVASVLYAFWVTLFLKRRRKLDSWRFEISSKNQTLISQLVHGMQDIKLSGAETPKRWEWERTQAKLFKLNVKNLSLSQYQQVGALLINNSKNIIITFLAAKAVIDGHLTLGGMMSVQYILAQFNAPIEQMIGFLQSWQDAKISVERLNEVHVLQDEEPASLPKRSEWGMSMDICLTNVTYTYPGAGNSPILKDINLVIPAGKTTAIVGTSGSGKTTLLKLLLRFYEPQNGTVELVSSRKFPGNNTSLGNYNSGDITSQIKLNQLSQKAWRLQCGVVMQEGFIFSDTIARNIAVNDEVIDQDRLYRAAHTANIHNFIDSLPLGYHTKIGAEGNGISQGQKQRILIARSIYKNPHLLLFDEATNALDSNNEATILQNLQDFFEGRTVVVVAHRLSTVKNAHQIVVMERGEIVERGTHDELVALKGKYLELVSNQLNLATS